ncbi:MAG TPA: L-serine ammonia-lyase [Baekduia sp.]|uniref:L-serine ammonia-lyase n=1 Tax=Baekduia sp. TaxID=2600305 RepID=UPI002D79F859|nr:L-serine ammonia-lyase [Baekduia sp.]HET6505356.1 L-serine ammonia-lyase [Baekduia sp.]
MLASTFELFRVGIGPSSSHTVGPMRAARRVSEALRDAPVRELRVVLHGSLALTGRGHGTDRALVAGLLGEDPETVDPAAVLALERVPATVRLHGREVAYWLDLQTRGGPVGHPNAMRFVAVGDDGAVLADRTFRSIGGGFVTEDGVPDERAPVDLPHAYASAAELLACADALGSVSAVTAANEAARRPAEELEPALRAIARAMDEAIERGLRAEGVLPGPLGVRRRAARLLADLAAPGQDGPLEALEWVGLWAMAVNEENAAGGRIVTAPTNGAAGILPAVLRYAQTFEGAGDDDAARMLLAASAVGALIKDKASISGAEVGCQGEVGSAAAMAAAALAEALGGTPAQVLNAAEIALEHHLGMTCDPIAGLVQVPCIERNAIGAGKAIAAAKLALRGDGRHVVSLDSAIEAMRRTGLDMNDKYKETSRGGLAVSVPAC